MDVKDDIAIISNKVCGKAEFCHFANHMASSHMDANYVAETFPGMGTNFVESAMQINCLLIAAIIFSQVDGLHHLSPYTSVL